MKKMFSTIKRQWRKIRYLDKTQLSYFVITGIIGTFCLFTGGTYSYFVITKQLNAATITIAKLNYNLSSTTAGYSNGNITVPAGETVFVDLTLDSLNGIETKYALNYSPELPNIEVYYSENLKNNMQGTIGPTGSSITMRVVIVNTGSTPTTVNLTADGGYVKNTLTSNITKGYYEKDITVRTILYDENLSNGIVEQDFPNKNGEYTYFRTQCSDNIETSWNNEKWNLELGAIQQKVACDVYFKKMTYDAELYFGLENNDGTTTFSDVAPSATVGTFDRTECNTDATATWNETTRQMSLTGVKSKTICIGYFKAK